MSRTSSADTIRKGAHPRELMELGQILAVAVRGGASDVHLKVGRPPLFRVSGKLVPLKDGKPLGSEEVERLLAPTMTQELKERFERFNDMDYAYEAPGLGRFRANLFRQKGAIGAVFRVIPSEIKGVRDLNLPPVVEKIALEQRGLVLVTGITGSGKSTTLAAMIDHINTHRTAHILTIEDPIEFVVPDKRSAINQREIGSDTSSFAVALRAALRQDPDVILVGEMRDLETMEIALTAAETGHLVVSTLHTLDATESINRIVCAFPPHQQQAIRLQLSSVLKAIISQRLVLRADNRGRAPALEVLRNTVRVRELIEDPSRTKELPSAIEAGFTTYGMQTFDQALMQLYRNEVITYEEALKQATNPDDFALRVSGVSSGNDGDWADFDKPDEEEEPDASETGTGKSDLQLERF